MAADLRFEGQLRSALRASLGAAEGPHATWAGAPSADIVADDDIRPIGRRRPSRLLVLLAAAVAIALIAAAVVAGGALRPLQGPQPPNGIENPAPVVPSLVIADLRPSAPVSPEPSTSFSPAPSDTSSKASCAASWSLTGTKSPKGLVDGIRIVEFDAYDGRLSMVFGHALDTVRGIRIEPTRPPFRTGTGATVKVAGLAFLQLTISGLTRPTTVAPPDMKYDRPPRARTSTVGGSILEMRRTEQPRSASPLIGPGADSTETWIIGLDHPACLTVTTMRLVGYGNDDPGDNAIVVDFG